jgi:phosphohistidine phosphatase
MELYLVQHGEAKPKDEDPERPLTERGFENARTMAEHASRLRVKVAEIRHSGKLRARQTAETFAQALGAPLSESKGLSPKDDVAPLAKELTRRSENLMIVGHLPHLARLASRLLCGSEEPHLVTFQNSGIVRLDRDTDGRFHLRWNLPPDVFL